MLPSSSNSRSCASVKPPSLRVPLRATRKSNHFPNAFSSFVSESSSGSGNNFSATVNAELLPRTNREPRAPSAAGRERPSVAMRPLTKRQPARSSKSSTSKPSSTSGLFITREAMLFLHATRSLPLSSNSRRNLIKSSSFRKFGRHICKNITPVLYMSKRSGRLSCHSTGDRANATGSTGASGVCLLIMYSSGALKRGSKMKSFGE
mmetsp:Transcript_5103/g.19751  ORF Transcript_5103/g.19751 Transcript_5103/m.19751 type:complete len:206 (+) Transcript_5103:259-876(+)